MKPALILFLLLSTFITNAQVQLWNTADLENEQWVSFYQSQKIKQLTVSQTDQNGKPIRENTPNSIRFFNNNAKPVATQTYKYSWKSMKNELLSADSLIYNDKGQLIRYSSFEGPAMRKVYESHFFYNVKGQQVKQEKYTMQDYQLTKEGTDIFTYDAGAKLVKLTSKNTPSVLDHTRQFSYDKQGRLIRAVFNSGSSITTDFSWNEKNQLAGYKELSGKDLSKTVTFTYDDKGRRTGKNTIATSGYFDNTTYYYRDNEMIPSATYLTYPGYGGKSDMRHEYMQMLYVFY